MYDKENNNLISDLVDLIIDTGKLTFKAFKDFYNSINGIDERFNFDEYFKNINLCTVINNEKQYPSLINAHETNEGEKFIFTIPTGYGKDSLNKFKDGLESAIGFGIEFSYIGTYWIIDVIKNDLPSFIKYELPPKINNLKIPLGKTLHDTIYIDLRENPNTFIVGTTGSGKSVCTKSILTSLINKFEPNELELYLCDLKRVELNLFKNVAHTKKFCYELTEILETFEFIYEECERRYNLFMDSSVTSIFDYNNLKYTENLPFKVLFVEEVVLLLKDKNNTGMKILKEIIPICRACGIYVFLTTQRPSADIIDSFVKACISNRICFKVEDEKNSIICIDDIGAEQLEGKGHGILKVNSNKDYFRGYYIEDKEVKQHIRKHFKKYEYNKNNVIEDISFIDKL